MKWRGWISASKGGKPARARPSACLRPLRWALRAWFLASMKRETLGFACLWAVFGIGPEANQILSTVGRRRVHGPWDRNSELRRWREAVRPIPVDIASSSNMIEVVSIAKIHHRSMASTAMSQLPKFATWFVSSTTASRTGLPGLDQRRLLCHQTRPPGDEE